MMFQKLFDEHAAKWRALGDDEFEAKFLESTRANAAEIDRLAQQSIGAMLDRTAELAAAFFVCGERVEAIGRGAIS